MKHCNGSIFLWIKEVAKENIHSGKDGADYEISRKTKKRSSRKHFNK